MFGKRQLTLMHNLYILQLDIPTSHHSIQSIQSSFSGSLKVDGDLWHKRLGHPSADKLLQLSGTLPVSKSPLDNLSHCSVCPLAKQKRLSFESNNHFAMNPFELVHLDV